MKWDDESYKKILMELIAQDAITWNYKLIADAIGCTERALKDQAQKMRRECREAGRFPGTPQTERIKKIATPKKTGKGKKATTTDDEEQDDVAVDELDDSMEEKRVRKRAKKEEEI